MASRRRAAAIWLLFLFLGVSLLLPSLAHAQANQTGSLSGNVTDANGAVLPSVAVTVKNTGTGQTRTAASDNEGRWTVPALPVGNYEVSYQLAGFRPQVRTNVMVEAAVPRTLEDQLQVGEIGERVTITEAAPLLTQDMPTTFRQISAEELAQVPPLRALSRTYSRPKQASAQICRPWPSTVAVTSRPQSTARARPRRASSSTALTRPTSPRTKAH